MINSLKMAKTTYSLLFTIFLLVLTHTQSNFPSTVSGTISGNIYASGVDQYQLLYIGINRNSPNLTKIVVYNVSTGSYVLVRQLIDPGYTNHFRYILFSKDYIIGTGDKGLSMFYRTNNTYAGLIPIISQTTILLKAKNIVVLGELSGVTMTYSCYYSDLSNFSKTYLFVNASVVNGLTNTPDQKYVLYSSNDTIFIYQTTRWSLYKTLIFPIKISQCIVFVQSGALLVVFSMYVTKYYIFDIAAGYQLTKTGNMNITGSITNVYLDVHSNYIFAYYYSGKAFWKFDYKNYIQSAASFASVDMVSSFNYYLIPQQYNKILTIIGYNGSTQLVYTYFNSLAVTPCPPSMYLDTQGLCTHCQPYCTSCVLGICNACYYSMGICCLFGQYYNPQLNTCVSCSNNCLTCDSPALCTNCILGYYPTNNYCCPFGYYYDTITFACYLCNPQCYTCENPNTCLQAADYTLVFIFCTDPRYDNNRVICYDWYTNPYVQTITQVNKLVVASPAIRQTLKMLTPLFVFNDQYWYYSYHNRNYTRLIVTSTFFLILEQINSQRLLPYFLTFIDELNNIPIFQRFFNKMNYTQYAKEGKNVPAQQDLYFILNIQSMLIWYYLGFIIGYLILKLVIIILERYILRKYLLSNDHSSNQMKAAIYFRNLFLRLTHPSVLIVGAIEYNIFIIIFQAVRQFKVGFQFSFSSKVNIVLAIDFLFICIFYSIAFYLIVYMFSHSFFCNYLNLKKTNKNQEKTSFKFGYEVIRGIIKISIFGFVQAAFLDNYITQISVLIALRVLFLIWVILTRSLYYKNWQFILDVIYYAFTIVYDTFLLYTYLVYEAFLAVDGWNVLNYHSLLQIILLFGIMGSVFVKISLHSVEVLKFAARMFKNIRQVSKTKTSTKQISIAPPQQSQFDRSVAKKKSNHNNHVSITMNDKIHLSQLETSHIPEKAQLFFSINRRKRIIKKVSQFKTEKIEKNSIKVSPIAIAQAKEQ